LVSLSDRAPDRKVIPRRDDKRLLATPKKEVTMIAERYIGGPLRAVPISPPTPAEPFPADEPTEVVPHRFDEPLEVDRTEPIVLDPRDEILPEADDTVGAIVFRSLCLCLPPLVGVAVIAWIVAAL
jgi:hypothetical protein